ncbi:type IV secretion system DNA-binding domain-containing protein [Burkholderia cepacia]|uniref:type IV secretion system DNA-binding domain-containing protein n=1 Tax=Burkholderia cepacia TaxID=292 RepID=UPI002650D0A3|nr:type IV secretion system DNA-binding domain-containing protein [Burkholderia cepacia]MDN7900829.1 type IV secretion system DNA-binding domain-containing protein [Burkholderia cepacia]
MTRKVPAGLFKDFSTGSEIWTHRVALVLVAIRNIVLISLFIGLMAGFLYAALFVDRNIWNQVVANVIAHGRSAISMTAVPMEYKVDGQMVRLPVDQVAAMTDPIWATANFVLRRFLIIVGTVTACACVAIAGYWYEFGRTTMADKDLRGATLVNGKQLARMVRENDDASPYTIAGVPMLRNAETLHTLVVGAQGTGKSQQFFDRLRQVRARGKRAIVYDPSGEFTEEFFRVGKDVMMNPFDDRSPNWNIKHEIEEEYHYDSMANGLIPDPREADPFWSLAGREVFRDVVRTLHTEGNLTNRNLYTSIAMSNLDAIYHLLRNTAGASYVDPKTERTGMSLKMTVQNQLSAFRFLRDDGQPFSIRQWIYNESDSWMFISTREEMLEAIKPILSLWIDIAIKSVLNLTPIHRERLHFSIDELPTLQKLDIMKLAVSNTRKYGLCMMLGAQDMPQFLDIYGDYLARTIINGCQTKLLLRVTDAEAAEMFAKIIGQTEVEEKDESLSFGLNSQRDGFSIAKRRLLRDLVLPSQISRLPSMSGYLVYPGEYPIARVKYGFTEPKKIVPAFIKRQAFAEMFSAGGGPTSAGPTSPTASAGAAPDWIAHPEILVAASGGIDPETGEILPPHAGAWRWGGGAQRGERA